MDLEQALAKIKELETANTALTTEVTTLKEDNTKLGEDIKERDGKITKLTNDATERAQQFKKFKDLSDAEKDLLTEKEKELMIRQEKLEDDQRKFQEEQSGNAAKEKSARIDAIATRMAKGNKDLVAQIKVNLGKLNPDLLKVATTEEELTPYIDSAFKMTGATVPPAGVREAHNTGGFGGEATKTDDFAGTKEGQDLAGAMGLSQATPEGQKAVESAGGEGAK